MSLVTGGIKSVTKQQIVFLLGILVFLPIPPVGEGQTHRSAGQGARNAAVVGVFESCDCGSGSGVVTLNVGGKTILFSYYPTTKFQGFADGRAWNRGAQWRITYYSRGTDAERELIISEAIFTRITPKTSESQRVQTDAVPEKAWPSFFAALRAAVQKRDRVALGGMMKPDFIFDCCDNMDENNNGETRDEGFRRWDKFQKVGWPALNRLLAQGVVPASSTWTSNNGRSKPSLIAPPSANSKRYRDPIADFEWRNGRWWFVSFQFPEGD